MTVVRVLLLAKGADIVSKRARRRWGAGCAATEDPGRVDAGATGSEPSGTQRPRNRIQRGDVAAIGTAAPSHGGSAPATVCGEGPSPLRFGAVLALAVLAAGVLAGCRDGGDAVADRPYAGLEQGLERAEQRARAGDAEGARREFFDNAHDALHRLAAEAAERDRGSAARLLEAKQTVERSMAEGTPTLAGDLARLRAAATHAARAVAPGGASRPEGSG